MRGLCAALFPWLHNDPAVSGVQRRLSVESKYLLSARMFNQVNTIAISWNRKMRARLHLVHQVLQGKQWFEKDFRHSLTVSHRCVLRYPLRTYGLLKYCWLRQDAPSKKVKVTIQLFSGCSAAARTPVYVQSKRNKFVPSLCRCPLLSHEKKKGYWNKKSWEGGRDSTI